MSELQNYIYLLQEREFIKTKENIYKVGMTKKENFTRFHQYPKGSVLLFQMICNNCQEMEKQVLKMFREKFVPKSEIGNEYFQGNYTDMIDVIYFVIKHENTCKPPEFVVTAEPKPRKPRTVKPRKKTPVEPQQLVPVEPQPQSQTEPVEEKTQTIPNNTVTDTLATQKIQEPVLFPHTHFTGFPGLAEYRKQQEERQKEEFAAMRKVFEMNRLLFPNGPQ